MSVRACPHVRGPNLRAALLPLVHPVGMRGLMFRELEQFSLSPPISQSGGRAALALVMSELPSGILLAVKAQLFIRVAALDQPQTIGALALPLLLPMLLA